MADGKLTKRITSSVHETAPKVEIVVPPEYTKERLIKEIKALYKEKKEHLSESIKLNKYTEVQLYVHFLKMKDKPVPVERKTDGWNI